MLNPQLIWKEDGVHWKVHEKHIQQLEEELGMQCSNSVELPLRADAHKLNENEEMKPADATQYRKRIARINYLAHLQSPTTPMCIEYLISATKPLLFLVNSTVP